MLARKARLPAAAGLGPQGLACWRWRAELAEHYATPSDDPSPLSASPLGGVASVAAATPGILAGYLIDGTTSSILWFDPALGTWTDGPAIVRARLAQAAASTTIQPPSSTALHESLRQLAEPLRWRLAIAAGRRWALPEPAAAARELATRLRAHATVVARQRGRRRPSTYRALAAHPGRRSHGG